MVSTGNGRTWWTWCLFPPHCAPMNRAAAADGPTNRRHAADGFGLARSGGGWVGVGHQIAINIAGCPAGRWIEFKQACSLSCKLHGKLVCRGRAHVALTSCQRFLFTVHSVSLYADQLQRASPDKPLARVLAESASRKEKGRVLNGRPLPPSRVKPTRAAAPVASTPYCMQ